MLTYNGASYTWMGRELRKITNGSNTYNYKYNADGIRTSKTVNGTTTELFLNGSQILAQKTGDSVMRFFYDSTGKRVGFANGTMLFYYLYNVQGDVIAIVRAATGQIVAKYSYDAWGKCTVTNAAGYAVGDKNLFRYRGYYYDTETGLYYLNSRYYNPEFGRFISADEQLNDGVLGCNLFAYCENNPVNLSDENGTLPSWAKKFIAAAAIVTIVAVMAAVTVATAGVGTAPAVIAVGAAKGAAIGMLSGSVIGGITEAIIHRATTGSWSGGGTAALNGMADGALSGSITGTITGAANSAVKVLQAAKAWDSGTFKSGYQSMKYHYNKHVISEGLTGENNVLKYTQDAVDFANRNSSVMKYTYNYNFGNASWNMAYSTGQGGMFTSTGKILTFWYR